MRSKVGAAVGVAANVEAGAGVRIGAEVAVPHAIVTTKLARPSNTLGLIATTISLPLS